MRRNQGCTNKTRSFKLNELNYDLNLFLADFNNKIIVEKTMSSKDDLLKHFVYREIFDNNKYEEEIEFRKYVKDEILAGRKVRQVEMSASYFSDGERDYDEDFLETFDRISSTPGNRILITSDHPLYEIDYDYDVPKKIIAGTIKLIEYESELVTRELYDRIIRSFGEKVDDEIIDFRTAYNSLKKIEKGAAIVCKKKHKD